MQKRPIIECNFVFSLWKQPALFTEYGELDENYFITEEGLFYFNIGKDLYKSKFLKFDESTLLTYFVDKADLRKKFEDYGGYKTVKEIVSMVEPDNIEGYFDNLVKGKIIKDLFLQGIEVDIDKFEDKTTDDLYEFYEAIINKTFLTSTTHFELDDMELTDEDITYLHEGSEMGIQFKEHCPRLNYHTLGIPKKEMTLIAGRVNEGKTTFTVSNILYPIAKRDTKVGMIANEQAIIKIKTLLLALVMFRELKDYSLSRRKLRRGNFTETQLGALKKAQTEFNRMLKDNFKFIKMYDYNLAKLKKAIRLLASLGCEVIFYDVLKAETGNVNVQAWQKVLDDSKDLLQLASKLDIALIVSMQLDQNKVDKRVLELDHLSTSKGVGQVVAEGIMLRALAKDEYTSCKHDCKAYKYEQNEDGTLKIVNKKTVKTLLTLDPDNEYIVVFHTKSRSDSTGTQILYEVRGDFAVYIEIGYCQIEEAPPKNYKKGA